MDATMAVHYLNQVEVTTESSEWNSRVHVGRVQALSLARQQVDSDSSGQFSRFLPPERVETESAGLYVQENELASTDMKLSRVQFLNAPGVTTEKQAIHETQQMVSVRLGIFRYSIIKILLNIVANIRVYSAKQTALYSDGLYILHIVCFYFLSLLAKTSQTT